MASLFLLARPDHILIVIEENHGYSSIIGSDAAPYINSLAQRGALFTHSYALTHPSQANYLVLFSGSTQGVRDYACPHTFRTPNLASALRTVGLSFRGYSEDLPHAGSTVCAQSPYSRQHNPWVNWQGASPHAVMPSENVPLSDLSLDWNDLPTVGMVVPNLKNNMHDGSDPGRIRVADAWLERHIGQYADWAMTHNSLLILTWDEDDGREHNHVPTIFVGPMVKPGRYDQPIGHVTVLRTIEELYGLPHSGEAAAAEPILDIWAREPSLKSKDNGRAKRTPLPGGHSRKIER